MLLGGFSLALVFLAPPLTAGAQQAAKVWRIGLFHVGLDHVPPSLEPLRDGLRALGYEEGKNIRLDWRNLADEEAALKTAREFVRDQVDLIVAFENQTARAAVAATPTIPVVTLHVTDPVADGLVKSMSHPGGNVTGFAGFVFDFPDKQLQLFKEAVPRLRRVAVLVDRHDPVSGRLLLLLRNAAPALKLELLERAASVEADLRPGLTGLAPGGADGVVVASPNLHVKFSSALIRLTGERRLPYLAFRREWVQQGALLSYAPDLASVGRAAATYVVKILQGAKPADLPVEQPTKFELAINLRTARALGLTIPPTLLLQADHVIK
jgi:putative ABC transport system substrate-binding protein